MALNIRNPGLVVIDTSELVAILQREPERRRFDKGQQPAGRNFGDCFAYALAPTREEPLLFKGMDVGPTDIKQRFQNKVNICRVDERSEIHQRCWWTTLRSSTLHPTRTRYFCIVPKPALSTH